MHVSCLYSQLAAQNLTMYNTFMETVSEERLAKYMLGLVTESFNVINSLEAEFNFKSVLSAIKSTIQKSDWDLVTSKSLLSFLRARSLVLGIDISQVFIRLDAVHREIGEGWWKLYSAKWPEMEQFISTFLTTTIKSDRFWRRVDDLFQELVARAKGMYKERARRLEDTIKTEILPFFRMVLDQLKEVQDKESPTIKGLLRMIETLPITSSVGSMLDQLTPVLSKHYLSCFTQLYGKPDFSQLRALEKSSTFATTVRDVVAGDWPEDQGPPAGLQQFAERLQEAVLLLVTGALGACAHPMG